MYQDRLQRVCESYKTVVMLGDSMGATAALLFAPMATSVLAFCPQVQLVASSHQQLWCRSSEMSLFMFIHISTACLDGTYTAGCRLPNRACLQVDLNTSSIRPGKPPAWFDSLRQNTLNAVRDAAARGVNIHVHCGSWLHDVDQVRSFHTRVSVYLFMSDQLQPRCYIETVLLLCRHVSCLKTRWTSRCTQWIRTAWHTTLTRTTTA